MSNAPTNLSLTCKAVEATSYYWERQDSSIPSGATGVDSETLTIVNLTAKDAGKYRCAVSHGSDVDFSNYAEITVKGLLLFNLLTSQYVIAITLNLK